MENLISHNPNGRSIKFNKLTGRVFSNGREKVGFAVGLNANLATYQQWSFR